MTKRMNIPENAEEMSVTEWDNIKATNILLPDLERWSCVCGIDYTKLTDWASVDLHFRDGDERFDISHSWMCLNSKDIPRIKAPWKEWADYGRLTLVDRRWKYIRSLLTKLYTGSKTHLQYQSFSLG